MTLVAAYLEDGVPVLFGDVMISHPARIERPPVVVLPTYDDALRTIPSDWSHHPVGTARKLVKLRRNVGLGWCGSELASRTVIQELEGALSERPSVDELAAALRATEPCGEQACALVGWVLSANGNTAIEWASTDREKVRFGAPAVQGSGEWHFREALTGSRGVGTAGMTSILRRFAIMLATDVFDGEYAAFGFGGGFDFMYAAGDELLPAPTVTFSFLRVTATPRGGVVHFVPRAIRYSTAGEDVFHVVLLTQEKGTTARIHLSRGILTGSRPVVPAPVTLLSEYNVVATRIHAAHADRSAFGLNVIVLPQDSAAKSFGVRAVEGGEHFFFSPEFLDVVRAQAEHVAEAAAGAPSKDIFDRDAQAILAEVAMKTFEERATTSPPLQAFDFSKGVTFYGALRAGTGAFERVAGFTSPTGAPSLSVSIVDARSLEFSFLDRQATLVSLAFPAALDRERWTPIVCCATPAGTNRWHMRAWVAGVMTGELMADADLGGMTKALSFFVRGPFALREPGWRPPLSDDEVPKMWPWFKGKLGKEHA